MKGAFLSADETSRSVEKSQIDGKNELWIYKLSFLRINGEKNKQLIAEF